MGLGVALVYGAAMVSASPKITRSVVALAVVAALARIVAALALGDRLHFVDEAIYLDAARHLLAGDGYGAGYANVPGQPLLLAVLAAPWPTSIMLVRVAHALVVGVVGVLLLHGLGVRTVGPTATRAALVLYAVDPLLVVAGGLLYPDAAAAVVLAGTLLAAVVATRADRLRVSATSGLLLGVVVLLRPVALVLGPLLVAWVAAVGPRSGARRAAHGVVAALACAAVVAPWLLGNLRAEGAALPPSFRGMQHAPVAADEIARDGLASSLARKAWIDPLALVDHAATELAHFWELYPTRLSTDVADRRATMHAADPRLPTDTTFHPGLRDAVSTITSGLELGLALTGIVLGWRRNRAAVVLLAGAALAYGLGYALFVAKLRYRIAVLPEVLLLAGLGIAALRRAPAPTADDRAQVGARSPNA